MVEGVWLLRYRMRGVDGSDALLWIHQQVQLRGGRQRWFSLDSSAGTVEGGIAAFIFSGLISPHSWGGGAAALIYSFFNSSWKCSDPYKIGIEEDFKAITKWILFCFTNNIANRFKSVYIVNLMFLMFMGPIKIIFFAKKIVVVLHSFMGTTDLQMEFWNWLNFQELRELHLLVLLVLYILIFRGWGNCTF